MNAVQPLGMIGNFRMSGSSCETLNCFWRIENFSTLDSTVGTSFSSDSFLSAGRDHMDWYMLLFPGGEKEEDAGMVVCTVVMRNTYTLLARITCGIQDSKNQVFAGSESEEWFESSDYKSCHSIKTPRDILLGQIEDDIIIVAASVTCTSTVLKVNQITQELQEKSPFLYLSDDYWNLWYRVQPDAVIVVAGSEFPVHRQVLSARSPVFATMFRRNVAVRETGQIVIDGFTPEAVKSMLFFMYSGVLYELNAKLASELIQIGIKYNVERLVSHCTHSLGILLDVSNVCDVIAFARSLRNPTLIRSYLIEFICQCLSADDMERVLSGISGYKNFLFDTLIRMKEIDPP